MPQPVLVIGAGMAGLTTAGALVRHGLDAVVIDKGRAPGGRMATRTVGAARFDHGAQHFGARSGDFRAAVQQWRAAGTVRPWFEASEQESDGSPNIRYAGVDGMRRIPELMAAGLPVRTGVNAVRLEQTATGVAAIDVEGTAVQGSAVVLTPPVPQTARLLAASAISPPPPVRAVLDRVTYDACLAVMARLEGPAGLTDGHIAPAGGPIAWLADNQHKGTSPVPAVTIHSTADFAAERLEAAPGEWTHELTLAAAAFLSSPVADAIGHRWRYARPRTTFDIGALRFSAGFPIVLAGEVFAGARVEGAFLSGLAAAEHIREMV